jgi:hypothetical protein
MKKNEIKLPRVLKPHGTAAWLLLNYPDISIEQVAAFCEMEPLKVLFLKSEIDDGKNYATHNPLSMGYVTEENLEAASEDNKVKLKFIGDGTIEKMQKKTRTYVSFLEKKNRLAGALWLINFYKSFNISVDDIKKLSKASSSNIVKLMTNKKFIQGIVPADPVKLGLCTREDFDNIISVYTQNK